MLNKEEIQDLYNQNLSGKEISSILNEKWTAIKYYASQYGIDLSNIPYNTKPKYITDKELKTAIDIYNSGEKSITALAEEYNIDRKILSKKMKEKGVIVRASGAKPINKNYFDKIDTIEKAYWLGFLYADGYIGKKGELEFCLQLSDKYAIENFRDALKSKHKISAKEIFLIYNGRLIGRTACRITITNKHMAEQLILKGCKNNKSFNLKFPSFDIVPKELFSHFLRGYFDGDGCVYTGKKHKRRCYISFSCASIDFCQSLILFLSNELNIISYLKKNKNVYSISIHKKDHVKIFLDYIYKNSTDKIRLKRKYEKSLISLEICRSDLTTTEESEELTGN